MAAMLSATTIWLASLATLPAPTSPTRVTEAAMDLSTGATASKSAALPPAMTVSVPSMALGSPPLTGASRKRTPFSANAAAISRLARGAIELMSTT